MKAARVIFILCPKKAESGAAPCVHTPPSYPELYDFLGHVGKGYNPLMRTFFWLAVGALVLASCGLPGRVSRNIGTGETLPVFGLEGRWAGPVGPAAPACGQETKGLMSVGSGAFAFDPFQSTTVIKGKVEGGALTGTLVRRGPNDQTLSITFEGKAGKTGDGQDAITGTLSSGRCRWSVALTRA